MCGMCGLKKKVPWLTRHEFECLSCVNTYPNVLSLKGWFRVATALAKFRTLWFFKAYLKTVVYTNPRWSEEQYSWCYRQDPHRNAGQRGSELQTSTLSLYWTVQWPPTKYHFQNAMKHDYNIPLCKKTEMKMICFLSSICSINTMKMQQPLWFKIF